MSEVICENYLSSISGLLDEAAAKLEKADISNPKLEAELLLSHILYLNHFDLYLKPIKLNNELIQRWEELVNRRSKRFPLQYLTGTANFMGLDFMVNPQVLIPRPETEILAELAINIILNMLASDRTRGDICILDIGTGSGNIAISLTKCISKCKIWATDISPQALEIAQANARRFGVEDKIIFILSDIWPKLGGEKQKFDLIISNPPYIVQDQLCHLPPEVKFEPTLALNGGEKGLDFYYRIITQSINYLNPNGYLMLELSDNQAQAVKEIIASAGKLSPPQIFKDLNNRERVISTYYG